MDPGNCSDFLFGGFSSKHATCVFDINRATDRIQSFCRLFSSALPLEQIVMPTFAERLDEQIVSKATPVLVGLDPRWDVLPPSIQRRAAASPGTIHERTARAFEEFCKELLDAVGHLVPAVKPQVAFFEQLGPYGLNVLRSVMQHARQCGLIVIADAKRGDIGSTSIAYAKAWLAGEDAESAAWPADALTVNPYLGMDSLQPFVDVAADRRAGLYVLVRTSNPGAADFQDLTADQGSVYEIVARRIQEASDSLRGDHTYGPVGAVVGATWPDQLSQLRELMPSVPFLIPGYGAQGGKASDAGRAFDERGLGAVINSSRGINFAFRNERYREQYTEERWQEAAIAATNDMIEDLRSTTPASALSAND